MAVVVQWEEVAEQEVPQNWTRTGPELDQNRTRTAREGILKWLTDRRRKKL